MNYKIANPKIKFIDRYFGITIIMVLYLLDKFSNKKTSVLEPKNILLIRLTNLGDAVISIPTIKALRQNFPSAKLSILASERTSSIYKTCPYIDEVIEIALGDPGKPIRFLLFGFFKFIKLIKKLRKFNFDTIIDLEPYYRITSIISYATGATRRIGFDTDGEGRGALYTDKVPYERRKHEVECLLDLIRPLGIKSERNDLEVFVSEDDGKKANGIFEHSKIKESDIIVVVHPGSGKGWKVKRWPKERYALIIQKLADNYRAKVIVIGNSSEFKLAKEIEDLSGKSIINLAGQLSMGILAAVIKKSSLFIGCDSAPMHIAAAVGTPVVALFGPVDPKKWGPYGKGHTVIWKNLSCSPCFDINKMPDCRTLECINSISPDEVLAAVKDKLKSSLKETDYVKA